MSKPNITPLGDRVLVKSVEEDEQVKGGIIIPDSAKEKPQEAKIIALGTGSKDDDGNAVTEEVAVETVEYGERATGETAEQSTVTKDHVGNWRGVIDLHDTGRAEQLLGEKAKIAYAHWATFAVPEPEEPEAEQLAKPDESNTVAEIKAYLDQEEIAYTSSQTKAELLALIPEEGE